MKSMVILISGRGSNMQALLKAGLPVAAVISNNPTAEGLAFAREHGIPAHAIDHHAFPDRKTLIMLWRKSLIHTSLTWLRSPASCVSCQKHLLTITRAG